MTCVFVRAWVNQTVACVGGKRADFNQLTQRKKTHCAVIPGSNKHTAKPIKEQQSNLPASGYGTTVCVCVIIMTHFINKRFGKQPETLDRIRDTQEASSDKRHKGSVS